jgi:hypothetical protein
MKRHIVLAILTLDGWLGVRVAHAATQPVCPIELVVGQLRQIDGDSQAVKVERGGQSIAVTVPMCLLHGDRLEAGIRSTVTVDTATGPRHYGGDFDPEWDVPPAHEQISSDLSTLFAGLFGTVIRPSQTRSTFATSRGQAACAQTTATADGPLAALGRLEEPQQLIGADLQGLVAAWRPQSDARDVQARLLDNDGRLVAEGDSCSEAPIFLPLPANFLHPGTHLTLSIADGHGGALSYRLRVVDAAQLPQPAGGVSVPWLAAAWRLAAGPADTHLDAIARLAAGPGDSLGLQRILDAVWSDAPF